MVATVYYPTTGQQQKRSNNVNDAERLAAEWLAAKKIEQQATENRIDIEKKILALIPAKEEGSSTTKLANGLSVKVTGKLSYKANIESLRSITSSWPEEARPLRTKLELDEPILRAIRQDRPDLWKQIAPAVSVKPAKTNVVVEEIGDGI